MKQHLRFWGIPGIAAIVVSELFCVAGVAYRKAIILTHWREKIAGFVFILCSPFGWTPSALQCLVMLSSGHWTPGLGKAGAIGSDRRKSLAGLLWAWSLWWWNWQGSRDTFPALVCVLGFREVPCPRGVGLCQGPQNFPPYICSSGTRAAH